MKRLALCGLTYLASGPLAFAGLDQDLDRMFDSMSNVTHPTAQMGQRRGVLSGGSVVIRNRVMRPNPVTFTPPGFSGGCGGIDFYGGSFSFINQSAFTGLLRSIAANAGGYAFQLGINAMCPDCGSLMSDLQKKVQALNEHLSNSCQLAQGIVNDGVAAMDAQQRSRLSQISLAEGLGDAFQSFTSAQGDPLERTLAHQPSRVQKTLTGNLIWRSLHQSKRGLSGLDESISWREAIMSVTGSIIIEPPAPREGASGSTLPVVRLPPLLGIQEFLQGGNTQVTSDNPPQVYRCDEDSTDGCLHPQTVPFEMKGLTARIQTVLAGPDGTTGILLKFATGKGNFTDEELRFMDQAPQSLSALLRNLSREDPSLARHFAEEAGPIIAIEWAGELIEEMIETARESGRMADHPYQPLIDEALDQTLSKLREERRSLENRWGTISSLVNRYQSLMQTGRIRDYGLSGSVAHGGHGGSP